MKSMKMWLIAVFLTIIGVGCCISSRNIVRETRTCVSGYYMCYTNGVVRPYAYNIDQNGVTNYVWYTHESICYRTSYSGGPYPKSSIYPATRCVLNILSGWSYLPDAYMCNLYTLPTYPIYLIELPIQLVLDTVLIPFDLLNTPNPPKGYELE